MLDGLLADVEIARDFHTVLISGVPQMDQTRDNPARRFIALVDECYDRRVPLYLEAQVALDELYTEGYLSFAFRRTLSRLQEMQLQRFKQG